MVAWAKNESVATRRRCDLIVYANAGSSPSTGDLADRGTDFIALGMAFVGGANSPDLDVAAGTVTNKRRALTITPFTFTSPGSNQLSHTAHGLQKGDGPVHLSTTGTLPTGLAINTDYWVIFVDANTFKLATSLANAYAGTAITITGAGTGTHTLSGDGRTPSLTKRGLDGLFTYQATQAELNHDASEMCVIIEGTGYSRASQGGTYTTVAMTSGGAFTDILEAGHTRDDALRAVLRDATAKIIITGSSYVVRDVADTKNSHHGTITAGGRSGTGIDDLT